MSMKVKYDVHSILRRTTDPFIGRLVRTTDQLNTFCADQSVNDDLRERLVQWCACLHEPATSFALEEVDSSLAETFVRFINTTLKPGDDSYVVADFFRLVDQ